VSDPDDGNLPDDDPIEGEDIEIITMYDDEGEKTEFIVISSVSGAKANYLLVAENTGNWENWENEESEALVLKEMCVDGEITVFETVTDDDEFMEAVKLFRLDSDDYEIEI
jgi:hypothetical protein